MKKTIVICPGNGCSDIQHSNWYGELFSVLSERSIPCVCQNFPDPVHARRDRWVPFIRSLAETQDNPDHAILIGHSSGAQAALSYAELYPIHACILVAATYTDLEDAHERASGYYPQIAVDGTETNSYNFEAMKQNCNIWHQFHSDDDPFISLKESERIRDGLGLTETYHVLSKRSHFFEMQPELLSTIFFSMLELFL